jgi:hypothetical protein
MDLSLPECEHLSLLMKDQGMLEFACEHFYLDTPFVVSGPDDDSLMPWWVGEAENLGLLTEKMSMNVGNDWKFMSANEISALNKLLAPPSPAYLNVPYVKPKLIRKPKHEEGRKPGVKKRGQRKEAIKGLVGILQNVLLRDHGRNGVSKNVPRFKVVVEAWKEIFSTRKKINELKSLHYQGEQKQKYISIRRSSRIMLSVPMSLSANSSASLSYNCDFLFKSRNKFRSALSELGKILGYSNVEEEAEEILQTAIFKIELLRHKMQEITSEPSLSLVSVRLV